MDALSPPSASSPPPPQPLYPPPAADDQASNYESAYPPPSTAVAAAAASAALSQHQHHHNHHNHHLNSASAPSPSSPNPRKRKSTSAPGSRGVANLTPEQLAKKRANDREAQRAIRERTKNTIGALEARIRELESQQPFQDLRRMRAERDRALAECQALRSRLGLVAGIVGAGAQQAQEDHLDPDLRPPPPPPQQPLPRQPSPLPSQTTNWAVAAAEREGGEGQEFPLEDESAAERELRKWSSSLGNAGEEETTNHRPTTSEFDPQQQQQQQQQHSKEEDEEDAQASSLPATRPASCPLDSLLEDFVVHRRGMLAHGASAAEVLGPGEPAWSVVLSDQASGDAHPVSLLLRDLFARNFVAFPPQTHSLPERVAFVYLAFLLLRWNILPVRSNFLRLPHWVRPEPEHFAVEQQVCGDYLPWPSLRASLAASAASATASPSSHPRLETFWLRFTSSLHLHWPLPHDCILLSPPSQASGSAPAAHSRFLNAAFEHHLRDSQNWSVGTELRDEFPEVFAQGGLRVRSAGG